MNTLAHNLGGLAQLNWRRLAAPLLIVMILGMMVLPLPPLLLDLLFTFNIALSIIVLLVSMYTVRPLDFAAFPTVLLLTTLLRLSLNVASTRVVLLNGHEGTDAAGKVIEAFGHFLVGGNYAVGFTVFVILVVINFVVITKGAGRIAEVSARFTLDAMPGKQMAIDADLNAGLIGEEEARRRRQTIAQEADFFGSMDGASKFVRGDAVAGILILVINVIGGLIVGVAQHDMAIGAAATNYTLLAIGDGLVAQIPALVISTAAGLVVSRVGTEQDVGQQLATQLFADPRVLGLAAGIVGALGLIPGMPHFAFLTFGAALGGAAYWHTRRRAAPPPAEAAPAQPAEEESSEASWRDVSQVDQLSLELGLRLIRLVDEKQDGDLLHRIKGLRKRFAQEIGYLPPAVHIRDNLTQLKPNAYRIALKGVEIGKGEAFAGMFMAINPGQVGGRINGFPCTDPAFGLEAYWIEAVERERAQELGYTVVDASIVVTTHFNQLLHNHADELLGRNEVGQLLDNLAKDSPKLVEEVVPKLVPVAVLQKVLRYLLAEGLHIRDLRSVVEVLSENAGKTQDPIELTTQVRLAMARSIVQQLWPQDGEVQVLVFEPNLERLLGQALQTPDASLEPGLAEMLLVQLRAAAAQREAQGQSAVLLVPPALRWPLAQLLRRAASSLRVLAQNEIPDNRQVRVAATIGGKG